MKHREYGINFEDKQGNKTHWVSLFIDKNTAVDFELESNWIFRNTHKKKSKGKWITYNILIIQSDDSIIWGFYCIAFKKNFVSIYQHVFF